MRTHMNVSRPFSLALLVTVCCLSNSGCGGGGEKVVSVSGTVTHNGQPVSGIVVSFVPEGATEAGVSTGTTDDNGKYELKLAKSGRSGAVVGMHKVWVSLPREAPKDDKEGKPKKDKNAAAKPQADLTEVLKKYGNLEKTPLTVEVKGSDPIDLKLD